MTPRPANVPKAILTKAATVGMMKARRDRGGFTNINDAIDLQKAEREYRLEKRKHIALVEDVPGG